jgi:hypothetical protein
VIYLELVGENKVLPLKIAFSRLDLALKTSLNQYSRFELKNHRETRERERERERDMKNEPKLVFLSSFMRQMPCAFK